MNPEEQPDEFVESALRDLRPRPANGPLRERLARAEPVRSTASARVPEMAWWRLLLRVAVPSVALLIAVLAVQQPPPVKPILQPPFVAKAAPASAEDGVLYHPVGAERIVLDSEELALLPGPDERLVQLMRVRVLDYEKGQADDGSELFITSEHEQVIPVTLTVY
ncbi:MAG: hypothetical protein ACPGVU_12535 [Limisphaerales bacterium]